jgi:hypothetical protein
MGTEFMRTSGLSFRMSSFMGGRCMELPHLVSEEVYPMELKPIVWKNNQPPSSHIYGSSHLFGVSWANISPEKLMWPPNSSAPESTGKYSPDQRKKPSKASAKRVL